MAVTAHGGMQGRIRASAMTHHALPSGLPTAAPEAPEDRQERVDGTWRTNEVCVTRCGLVTSRRKGVKMAEGKRRKTNTQPRSRTKKDTPEEVRKAAWVAGRRQKAIENCPKHRPRPVPGLGQECKACGWRSIEI
jgi:hypothetical protein